MYHNDVIRCKCMYAKCAICTVVLGRQDVPPLFPLDAAAMRHVLPSGTSMPNISFSQSREAAATAAAAAAAAAVLGDSEMRARLAAQYGLPLNSPFLAAPLAYHPLHSCEYASALRANTSLTAIHMPRYCS